MKDLSYLIDNEYLTIRILGGSYKFKIESKLATATQTIEYLFREIRHIDAQFGVKREKIEPIVKILLASLNIAGQCIDMQKKSDASPPSPENPIDEYEVPANPQRINWPNVNTTHMEHHTVAAKDDYFDCRPAENAVNANETINTYQPQTYEDREQIPEDSEIEPTCSKAPNHDKYVSTDKQAKHDIIIAKNLLTYEPGQHPYLSIGHNMEQETSMPQVVPSNNKTLTSSAWDFPIQKRTGDIVRGPSFDVFDLPPLSFLQPSPRSQEIDRQSIRRNAEILEKKLAYFGIKGEVMEITPGPIITTFEYKPAPGVKISKIVNLADDIALALSAMSVRIVAPIPGKDVLGIEIPNRIKSIVPFRDVVDSQPFLQCSSKIPICLGKDIVGKPVVVELDKMPHLLIAGATGTGKSVALNAMITSILYKSSPKEVKFLMIDPKRIELSLYNNIPHLITPVLIDMNKANNALAWLVREMERRYDLLAEYQVRNIIQFNRKIKRETHSEKTNSQPLPYIVVIIDELADLMMTSSRDVEFSLTRLAQMARAAGIHLIVATQRPSVDVLTGVIKANFPTRISFQVSSKTDSRTIIDSNGAETLLGNGDMLFVPPGTSRLKRVHGTYISENELVKIVEHLKAQKAPEYVPEVTVKQEKEITTDVGQDDYDEKYNEALEFICHNQQASISSIQRALRIGYNRAARIIDSMEKDGIVSPSDGSKPRKVIGSFN